MWGITPRMERRLCPALTPDVPPEARRPAVMTGGTFGSIAEQSRLYNDRFIFAVGLTLVASKKFGA